MDLILTVVADPQGANMRNHTKVFDQSGGSFGRADDNTWVLPDPERVVSSHHATIAFEAGKYFVIDSSTNGTFLNDAPAAVQSGAKQPLTEGDVLGVGDYRLKVSMRVPEIKANLPKGLAPVDFFDENDKTRMSEANAENMQSGVADFDHFLEPNAQKSAQDDQWGYLNDSQVEPAGIKPIADDSLLASTHGASAKDLDPLARLGGGDRSEIAWDNDEDWWKSPGSEADNAPLDRHTIDVKPVAPQPAPVPQIPVPPPSRTETPPPISPPPSSPAVEDNPFQGSADLMDGISQGDDSSDLLNSVGASSEAGFEATPDFPPMPQSPPSIPVPIPQAPQAPPQAPVPPDFAEAPAPVASPAIPPAKPVGNQLGVSGQVPQAPQPVDVQDIRALAHHLGLGNINDEQLQQLLPDAAAIIQESVARLIELMRARTSMKNEMRVEQTMIQLQDNNPLKFSVTAKDAMAAMFGTSNPAFMSPGDAIKDSFDDLSDHQMAVLNGMRAAYEFMLQQFSPKSLENRLGVKSALLSKNAKKWEAYEKHFESLRRDPETAYRRLFGEEFASAYESQLNELKNSRVMKRKQ